MNLNIPILGREVQVKSLEIDRLNFLTSHITKQKKLSILSLIEVPRYLQPNMICTNQPLQTTVATSVIDLQ